MKLTSLCAAVGAVDVLLLAGQFPIYLPCLSNGD